jgi:hypothetical protein
VQWQRRRSDNAAPADTAFNAAESVGSERDREQGRAGECGKPIDKALITPVAPEGVFQYYQCAFRISGGRGGKGFSPFATVSQPEKNTQSKKYSQ